MVRLVHSLVVVIASAFISVPTCAHAAPGDVNGAILARCANAKLFFQCKTEKQVAITLDDGPGGNDYMKDAVDILVEEGAKATFFVNGYNYGCIFAGPQKDAIKYAFDKGMQIASHSWSHPNFTELHNLSQNEQHRFSKQQVDLLGSAVQNIIGSTPRYFRFPYGESTHDVRNYMVKDLDLVPVHWDVDSFDSSDSSDRDNTVNDYDEAINKMANSFPKPHIFLSHVPKEYSSHEGLQRAITILKERGYNLVTAAECLGEGNAYVHKAYDHGDPDTCDGTPLPDKWCPQGEEDCLSHVSPVRTHLTFEPSAPDHLVRTCRTAQSSVEVEV